MRIGKMRHLLRLQRRTIVRDAGGGSEDLWQDGPEPVEIWAEILPQRTVLRADNRQQNTEISHKIRTRYRSDLKAGDRMLAPESGRCFYIEGVIDPDERQCEIEIYAREAGAT